MDELIRVQSRDGSERFLRFDDEMIERAARSLHDWESGKDTPSWECEEDFTKDQVRDAVLTVLAAAFNHEEAHRGD